MNSLTRMALTAACLLSFTALLAAAPQPGPCCPRVKGQRAPVATKTPAGTTITGPRFVCLPEKTITLKLGDVTAEVAAMEAAGSLLTPARSFEKLGALVEPTSRRNVAISLANRRIDLTLGLPTVEVSDGIGATTVTWPLCPRLLQGVTWVPLRAAAQALSLDVAWQDGAVQLTPSAQPLSMASAAPSAESYAEGSCPADRVDNYLKVTVVRSPVATSFGAGTQISKLADDSPLTALGVQAKDILISWNGKPVQCPKDLDAILEKQVAAGETVTAIEVVRAGEKLPLPEG